MICVNGYFDLVDLLLCLFDFDTFDWFFVVCCNMGLVTCRLKCVMFTGVYI